MCKTGEEEKSTNKNTGHTVAQPGPRGKNSGEDHDLHKHRLILKSG